MCTVSLISTIYPIYIYSQFFQIFVDLSVNESRNERWDTSSDFNKNWTALTNIYVLVTIFLLKSYVVQVDHYLTDISKQPMPSIFQAVLWMLNPWRRVTQAVPKHQLLKVYNA